MKIRLALLCVAVVLVALQAACIPAIVGAVVGTAAAQKTIREGQPNAWLGVKVCEEKGILIQEVLPGSPAASAGILPGDQLLDLNQAGIYSIRAARKAIERCGVGNAMLVSLMRSGKPMEVTATLGARPGSIPNPDSIIFIPERVRFMLPRDHRLVDPDCRETSCPTLIAECTTLHLRLGSPGKCVVAFEGQTTILEGNWTGRLYDSREACELDASSGCGLII